MDGPSVMHLTGHEEYVLSVAYDPRGEFVVWVMFPP